jgi:hypothetical protein
MNRAPRCEFRIDRRTCHHNQKSLFVSGIGLFQLAPCENGTESNAERRSIMQRRGMLGIPKSVVE